MLSIITPAHNEEKIVESFVKNAIAYFHKKKIDGEVLVVENGSSDKTLEKLKGLKFKELKIISLPTGNKGLALKRGLMEAKGDYLVTIDTDLWDEKFVESSLNNLQKFDIVIGSKVIRGAKDNRPFLSRLMNYGYNFITRLFFDFQGTETHAKLSFSRRAISPLIKKCKTEDLVFDTELILRAEREGLTKLEIPTQVKEIRSRRFSVMSQLVKTARNFLVLFKAIGPKLNMTYVLVFGAIILGTFLRFYQYHNWFFFSVDEEHYSFMTRMITVDHHFPLIGGPISGTKLYMAPWFLYFNAILFLISNNNPVFSGVIFTGIEIAVILLVYLIGKKIFNRRVGTIAAVLYGGSMLMALFDRHYWNITLVPIISTLTVYGLLNWIDGDKKWLVLTAVVVGFGLSATFSIFAVFIFAVLIIFFYGKKDLPKFLAIIALMHITLVLFDLRHDFWLLRGLGEFFTKHSYDSTPFIERVFNTFSVFINTLAKSIVITIPLNLSDEISICKENILRYQPDLWAKILVFISLIGVFNRKAILILILGLINIASLFLFRADPAERHWLPFLPLFFVSLGFFLNMVWEKNDLYKILVIGFIMAMVSINFMSLVNSRAPYGISKKEKVVRNIINKTSPGQFYLNSIGDCHKWGYRYLFSQFNYEPAASFMDDSFSWMYSIPPQPENAKEEITIYETNF